MELRAVQLELPVLGGEQLVLLLRDIAAEQLQLLLEVEDPLVDGDVAVGLLEDELVQLHQNLAFKLQDAADELAHGLLQQLDDHVLFSGPYLLQVLLAALHLLEGVHFADHALYRILQVLELELALLVQAAPLNGGVVAPFQAHGGHRAHLAEAPLQLSVVVVFRLFISHTFLAGCAPQNTTAKFCFFSILSRQVETGLPK